MPADLPAEAGSLVAFLLTYGLHSTLLLGAAWLLATWSPVRSATFRESVWKLALLGPILTSVVATLSDQEPWGGQIVLVPQAERKPSAHPQDHAPPKPAIEPFIAPRENVTSPAEVAVAPFNPVLPHTAGEFESRGGTEPAGAVGEPFRWGVLALGLWLCGMVWSGRRILKGGWSLGKVVGGCTEINAGPLRERLDVLLSQTGIRKPVQLFVSTALTGPIAVGVLRWRIGVPTRAVTELDAEEQEGLLAHELAHLVRRDCLWLWGARIVEAIFFFQPLNRLAGKHLRAESEYLCDAWVVEHTGDGISLARCLASVAEWVARAHGSLPVPSMAGSGSMFARRIEALVSDSSQRGRRPKPLLRRTLMGCGWGLVVLLGLAGPRAVVRSAAITEMTRSANSSSKADQGDSLLVEVSEPGFEPSWSLSADLLQAARELNDLETELRNLAPILIEADFDEDRVRLLRTRLARLKAHRRRLEGMATTLLPKDIVIVEGMVEPVFPRTVNPYPVAPSLQGEKP